METFSYLLCREGRTLYFAVLEQPEEWRGGGSRGVLSWEGFEGKVRSSVSPEIGEETVYLRGRDRGADRQVHQRSFADEHDATEKEAHVRRLLAEFVKAGGFSGKRSAPTPGGAVTTYTL